MTVDAQPAPLLALFSDFGVEGPYCGQVMAVWAGLAPTIPRVDLFSGCPAYDIEAAAHLLYAYTRFLPKGSVIEAVVDPGVGGDRQVCVVEADGYWFCGPDNGLMSVVTAKAHDAKMWHVRWLPDGPVSMTFHGRDVFAPLAAHIALYGAPPEPCLRIGRGAWHAGYSVSEALCRVIMTDPYGNLITSLYADSVDENAVLQIAEHDVRYAERFEQVPVSSLFWYVNSNGLIEIAANQDSAAEICKYAKDVKIVRHI